MNTPLNMVYIVCHDLGRNDLPARKRWLPDEPPCMHQTYTGWYDQLNGWPTGALS